MPRSAIFLLSLLLLTSCSTAYQDANNPFHITGGYGSEKGLGNLDTVYFYANGYTTPEQANEFAVRRAAELAQSKHMPYFALYQTLGDAAKNKKTTSPLTTYSFDKPTSRAFIVYHEHKEAGDISTAAILNKYTKKG